MFAVVSIEIEIDLDNDRVLVFSRTGEPLFDCSHRQLQEDARKFTAPFN